MGDPFRQRRLPPAEVRRVLRRAIELAEKDSEIQATEQSFSEDELARLAGEIGIPKNSLQQAAREDSPLETIPAEGAWLGFPLRTLLEEELDGEITADSHEDLVDAIQVVMGDAGRVQIVGKTLTWTPTVTPSGSSRQLTVTVRARNGRTSVRVDELHRNLAAGLFLGLGFGLGFGGSIPTALIVYKAFYSGLISIFAVFAMLAGVFVLARVLYTAICRRHAKSQQVLMRRLTAAVRAAPTSPRITEGKKVRVGVDKTNKVSEVIDESEANVEADAEAEAESEVRGMRR